MNIFFPWWWHIRLCAAWCRTPQTQMLTIPGSAATAVANPHCCCPAGDLRFDQVSLRYFPGGPLALRHVSFHVQDCKKVSQTAAAVLYNF